MQTEGKYLGLMFDRMASSKHMALAVWRKSRQAWAALSDFVRKSGWQTPGTRLLLLDVLVRSIMTYGAPVWGT
jgi:hypothetical protein